MAIQTVFSDNLNPTTGSLTSRFKDAIGFYIDAPFIDSELEIDVFLQVFFPTQNGEKIRNLPLGRLSEGQITLNQTDTESLITIPGEYVDRGLEMALFFLSSDITYLEVYVVGTECSLCDLKNDIDEIKNELSTVKAQAANNGSSFLSTLSTIYSVLESFQTPFDYVEQEQLQNNVIEIKSDINDIQNTLGLILNALNLDAPPTNVSPVSAQQQLLFRR